MDHRSRQDTHDTGSPQARPRDDLRTANKKAKPNEQRDEQRDRETKETRDESGPEDDNENE
jgi:hypothetical protein